MKQLQNLTLHVIQKNILINRKIRAGEKYGRYDSVG